MKTLNTIQTLSKIAKVFCKIIFICAIIGLCGCIAGILSKYFGFEAFKLGGVTIQGLIQDKANLSDGELYADMFKGAVYSIGTLILFGFAGSYFKRELNDGTPFTFDGAKNIFRLGILTICISCAEKIVYTIGYSIISKRFADVSQSELEAGGYVGIGIALIIISLLCKYGAESMQNKDPQ